MYLHHIQTYTSRCIDRLICVQVRESLGIRRLAFEVPSLRRLRSVTSLLPLTLTVHQTNQPPSQIQEHAILAPGANLILEHVTPVAGFLVRPDAPNNGNSPPGAFIWSGKFVTQPGQADAVIAALKTNIPYIEAQEPGTISFLVLKGEGEQTVYVWERYVDERSLREVHHVSEGYLRMRERLGPLILERSISGYYEVMGFLTKEGGVIQQQ